MTTKPAKLTAALESTISFVLAGSNHNVTAGQLHGLVCAQLRAQTRNVAPHTVAAVRRAADRMVGERTILGAHDAVHAERRYTAHVGAPDAPRRWFPVTRPESSGQHACPNMHGYLFGRNLQHYDAEQHPIRARHVALMSDGRLELCFDKVLR